MQDGINAVRSILPVCEFDAEGCEEGLKVLKAYRREWDEHLSMFKNQPRHDWASHGSDAFGEIALTVKEVAKAKPKRERRVHAGGVWG